MSGTWPPLRGFELEKSAPLGGMKMVDKDRVKGSLEQVKGKVKEWAG
jgi:hypothetical protein